MHHQHSARVAAAWDDVLSHCVPGIRPGLETMRQLMAALGEPQTRLGRVVHIAGTNGKGSTAAFLAAMCAHTPGAKGLKRGVATFRSPGLRGPLSSLEFGDTPADIVEDILLAACAAVGEAARVIQPSPFEAETAVAFQALSAHASLLPGAPDTIIECGLGGRDDATNVLTGTAVTIITAIGRDHEALLGRDLEAIADHKAGIMRAGTPVVIARQPAGVAAHLVARAETVGAPVKLAGSDWMVREERQRLIYSDEHGLIDLPKPALEGRFQFENAGSAITAWLLLERDAVKTSWGPVTKAAGATDDHRPLSKGLRTVVHPGRLTRLDNTPDTGLVQLFASGSDVWVDGGHNSDAAQMLAREMAELNDRDTKPLILILGCLENRAPADLLAPFVGLAEAVIA
ncbi:MAG: hypothetical protein AAFO79_11315, partial [Pseudomonadota bacterium]